ncbi:MAG: hypothetical protein COA78_15250 [Blastopirellula sp.]|nr:MAG: hypothetical protein COA78_15250 [Blastopirellula sp.]
MTSNHTIEQTELDQLVDGELDSPAYQALLSRMDQQPEAWKHCAMTFLEAQALEQEFSVTRELLEQPITIESNTNSTIPDRQLKTTSVFSFNSPFAITLSLAICCLVAFVLGRSSAPQDEVPLNPIFVQTGSPDQEGGVEDSVPQQLYVHQFDGHTWDRIPIQLHNNADFDPTAPIDTSFGFSAEYVTQLREQGYQLETQTGYLPVSLSNGQQAVIPMQEVVIQPESSYVIQ